MVVPIHANLSERDKFYKILEYLCTCARLISDVNIDQVQREDFENRLIELIASLNSLFMQRFNRIM